jgi:hypothetical protein
MNEEDKVKILEDAVRFYAERENAEVAYITINDGEKPIIYEEDKDRGFVAQMALSLLGLPYDKEAMPNGYALVPQKTKELTEQNKKFSLGERLLEPLNFYNVALVSMGIIFLPFFVPLGFYLSFLLLMAMIYYVEVVRERGE